MSLTLIYPDPVIVRKDIFGSLTLAREAASSNEIFTRIFVLIDTSVTEFSATPATVDHSPHLSRGCEAMGYTIFLCFPSTFVGYVPVIPPS